MAFSFETSSSKGNWFTISIVLIVVFGLGFGTYFLFFAPTPFVEVLAPTDLKVVSDLSKVGSTLDSNFLKGPAIDTFDTEIPNAQAKVTGRTNPFAPF